jgi:hypothetical protein
VSGDAAVHLRLCADQTVAGFRGWQCAHIAVARAGHCRVTRDGRVHIAAFRPLVMPTSGPCSLAWLSASVRLVTQTLRDQVLVVADPTPAP